MPPQEKQQIDDLFVKFFVACNVSLSTSQSKHLDTLLNKLRPSYHPPSLEVITENIIDSIYAESVKQVKEYKAAHGVLLIHISDTGTVLALKFQKSLKSIVLKSCKPDEDLRECVEATINQCIETFAIDIKYLCIRSSEENIELRELTIPWYNCTVSDAEKISNENIKQSTLDKVRSILLSFDTEYLKKTTGYE